MPKKETTVFEKINPLGRLRRRGMGKYRCPGCRSGWGTRVMKETVSYNGGGGMVCKARGKTGPVPAEKREGKAEAPSGKEFLPDEQVKSCFDAAVGILSGLRTSYTRDDAWAVVEILHRYFAREMRGTRLPRESDKTLDYMAERLHAESEAFIAEINEALRKQKELDGERRTRGRGERETGGENVMYG